MFKKGCFNQDMSMERRPSFFLKIHFKAEHFKTSSTEKLHLPFRGKHFFMKYIKNMSEWEGKSRVSRNIF